MKSKGKPVAAKPTSAPISWYKPTPKEELIKKVL
jgi:hypothetical protein